MSAIGFISLLLGLALFLMTAMGTITSMLVPRPRISLVSRIARRSTRKTLWFIASRRDGFIRQDSVLATVAPLSVLVELCLILFFFVVAFALMMFGVSPLSSGDSFFQAGSTLLTLGIVEPVNPAQVVIGFSAAFTGLVVIAVLIGYLLALYSAFTSRESQVAKSALLAGEPSWGPELICRRHLAGDGPVMPEADGWVDWVCNVRSSHTMYPVLTQFRSYSPSRSWITTLLAMLDATALQLTVCRDSDPGECVEFLAEGIQTVGVLQRNERAPRHRNVTVSVYLSDPVVATLGPGPTAVYAAIQHDTAATAMAVRQAEVKELSDIRLTRKDFDDAVDLMRRAGVPLRDDLDKGWDEFQQLRMTYERNAEALARNIHAVPAPWSGPRRLLTQTVYPTLAADVLEERAS